MRPQNFGGGSFLSPLLILQTVENNLARGCGRVRSRKPGEVGTRFASANHAAGEGATETAETPSVEILLLRQCVHALTIGQ